MAGYTSANNVLGFLFVSINSVSQASMSFTSQNYSVNKFKRMDKVLRNCILLDVIIAVTLGGTAGIFGRQILGIFSKETAVIEAGLDILYITSVTYFICAIMDLIPGTLRGMGYSFFPMMFSIIGTVGTRIVWIYGLFPTHHSLDFLFISYPVSWAVTVFMQMIYYIIIRMLIKKRRGEGVT